MAGRPWVPGSARPKARAVVVSVLAGGAGPIGQNSGPTFTQQSLRRSVTGVATGRGPETTVRLPAGPRVPSVTMVCGGSRGRGTAVTMGQDLREPQSDQDCLEASLSILLLRQGRPTARLLHCQQVWRGWRGGLGVGSPQAWPRLAQVQSHYCGQQLPHTSVCDAPFKQRRSLWESPNLPRLWGCGAWGLRAGGKAAGARAPSFDRCL